MNELYKTGKIFNHKWAPDFLKWGCFLGAAGHGRSYVLKCYGKAMCTICVILNIASYNLSMYIRKHTKSENVFLLKA